MERSKSFKLKVLSTLWLAFRFICYLMIFFLFDFNQVLYFLFVI